MCSVPTRMSVSMLVRLHVFVVCWALERGGAKGPCLRPSQEVGVRAPSPGLPEISSRLCLSSLGSKWENPWASSGFRESQGCVDPAVAGGCGAIHMLNPFRSCGFLWAWGSCWLCDLACPWWRPSCCLPRSPIPQQGAPPRLCSLTHRKLHWGQARRRSRWAPRPAPWPTHPAGCTAAGRPGPLLRPGPHGHTMFGRRRSVSFGGFGWWVTDGRGVRGWEPT